MLNHICTSKLLLGVVLLLMLASPVFAGDAEDSRLGEFEPYTSSPVFTQLLFFLPADKVGGIVDNVFIANVEFRMFTKRLKPVGTLATFKHFRIKETVNSLPNVLTLKQVDMQKMIDWELAVTRDMKEVAVAVNLRF